MNDMADLLSDGPSTVTGKHRHKIQAKQAWIKYQV